MSSTEREEYLEYLLKYKIKMAQIAVDAKNKSDSVDTQLEEVRRHINRKMEFVNQVRVEGPQELIFKQKVLKIDFLRRVWNYMKSHKIFHPVVRVIKKMF